MSLSQTPQEALFRSLVSDLIERKITSKKEKEFRLHNFMNQADFYYDVFCESVYMLMINSTLESVSIDDSGFARFNVLSWEEDCGCGFELVTQADILNDIDDVIVYIDIALSRLAKRLSAGQSLSFPI